MAAMSDLPQFRFLATKSIREFTYYERAVHRLMMNQSPMRYLHARDEANQLRWQAAYDRAELAKRAHYLDADVRAEYRKQIADREAQAIDIENAILTMRGGVPLVDCRTL